MLTCIFLGFLGAVSRCDSSGRRRAGQSRILSDLQHFPQFLGQMCGNVCLPKAAVHLSVSVVNIHSVLTVCKAGGSRRTQICPSHRALMNKSLQKSCEPDFQPQVASAMCLTKNILSIKWFLEIILIFNSSPLTHSPMPLPVAAVSLFPVCGSVSVCSCSFFRCHVEVNKPYSFRKVVFKQLTLNDRCSPNGSIITLEPPDLGQGDVRRF